MDVRQRSSLQSLEHAQQFLDDHGDVLAAVNGSPARSDLDQAVRRLQEAAAAQEETETRTRSLTRHKNMLRRTLLRHNLGPIVRIVRGRPMLFPTVQDTRMPRKGANDAEVITAVYAVLRWLPAQRENLVGQGLRANFVERLRESVEEFARAIAERWRQESGYFVATKTIPKVLAEAWTSVDMVGALIDDAEAERNLLVAWRATHLHRPRTAALATPEGAVVPALPAAPEAPAASAIPGAPAATVAPVLPPASEVQAASAVQRRGVFRVIARVLNVDRAA
jgi:hypothetical protein